MSQPLPLPEPELLKYFIEKKIWENRLGYVRKNTKNGDRVLTLRNALGLGKIAHEHNWKVLRDEIRIRLKTLNLDMSDCRNMHPRTMMIAEKFLQTYYFPTREDPQGNGLKRYLRLKPELDVTDKIEGLITQIMLELEIERNDIERAKFTNLQYLNERKYEMEKLKLFKAYEPTQQELDVGNSMKPQDIHKRGDRYFVENDINLYTIWFVYNVARGARQFKKKKKSEPEAESDQLKITASAAENRDADRTPAIPTDDLEKISADITDDSATTSAVITHESESLSTALIKYLETIAAAVINSETTSNTNTTDDSKTTSAGITSSESYSNGGASPSDGGEDAVIEDYNAVREKYKYSLGYILNVTPY